MTTDADAAVPPAWPRRLLLAVTGLTGLVALLAVAAVVLTALFGGEGESPVTLALVAAGVTAIVLHAAALGRLLLGGWQHWLLRIGVLLGGIVLLAGSATAPGSGRRRRLGRARLRAARRRQSGKHVGRGRHRVGLGVPTRVREDDRPGDVFSRAVEPEGEGELPRRPDLLRRRSRQAAFSALPSSRRARTRCRVDLTCCGGASGKQPLSARRGVRGVEPEGEGETPRST